jgi:hypothetical protein
VSHLCDVSYGSLTELPGSVARSRTCSRHAIVAYESHDLRRARIEAFVQQAFARRHGACIKSFMPTLLALQGRGDCVCGVVGFRNAGVQPLFLERYFAQPVEAALRERTGLAIDRERIVEVGNLASLSCRAAFHLVAVLPRVLIDRGNQWIVFTATSAVRGILEKFRAPMIELATASRDRVDNADEWGRYYESDPRVMAGYLPDGIGLALRGARGLR